MVDAGTMGDIDDKVIEALEEKSKIREETLS
jgi:hypothetical protein